MAEIEELRQAIELLCRVLEKVVMTTEVTMGLGQHETGAVLGLIETARQLAR